MIIMLSTRRLITLISCIRVTKNLLVNVRMCVMVVTAKVARVAANGESTNLTVAISSIGPPGVGKIISSCYTSNE